MKRFLFLILACSLPAVATDFTWQAPTEYEDGTALTIADLAEYSLICQGETFTYPGDVMMSMEDFVPGTYICTLTVTATNGLTSTPSNAVTFTVAPPPSPPKAAILSVTN